MRVDAVLEPDPAERLDVPWTSAAAHYLDLRHNVRSIYQIEAARQHPPLGRFLATVNSDDSVFATATARVEATSNSHQEQAAHRFSSRIAVVFLREESNFEPSHFEGLIGQLQRLLSRDNPADSLALRLRIGPCHFARLGRDGFHLAMQLAAEGPSAEQAELRWGLGLARVQQALLFLSRVVRQHLHEAGGA